MGARRVEAGVAERVDETPEAIQPDRGAPVIGGLRPGGLRVVAETGVDALSLGWLTHSARAADVAMEIDLRD